MTIDRISQRGKLFIGLLVVSTVSFPIVIQANSANAASLIIPTTTVNGTDVFSGPSFTINSNFLGTDTINLTVSGEVQQANNYNPGILTNAARIVSQPGSLGVFPGQLSTFGALLLGNNTLGFQQVFASTAANGLGSSTPPTTLSISNVSLNSIFGAGLATGTVLEFRVSDSDTFNNGGAFTVNGSINGDATTAVPEPFTIIGTLIGGTAALRMRKKLTVKS